MLPIRYKFVSNPLELWFQPVGTVCSGLLKLGRYSDTTLAWLVYQPIVDKSDLMLISSK